MRACRPVNSLGASDLRDFPTVPPEKVRLRIGNLAKAVLVTGQAYQDPKDALNEFVSNAADEYAEAGCRARPDPRRAAPQGPRPVIAIDDAAGACAPTGSATWPGACSSRPRPATCARSARRRSACSPSNSSGAAATSCRGREDSAESWVLRLVRGTAVAHLDRERRRARTTPGTTVYLHDLDPDVLRLLTQRKVVDYLRTAAAALARGDYVIEVVEGARPSS